MPQIQSNSFRVREREANQEINISKMKKNCIKWSFKRLWSVWEKKTVSILEFRSVIIFEFGLEKLKLNIKKK